MLGCSLTIALSGAVEVRGVAADQDTAAHPARDTLACMFRPGVRKTDERRSPEQQKRRRDAPCPPRESPPRVAATPRVSANFHDTGRGKNGKLRDGDFGSGVTTRVEYATRARWQFVSNRRLPPKRSGERLTDQGNRRPPRREAPPVGVRVDRWVRPRFAHHLNANAHATPSRPAATIAGHGVGRRINRRSNASVMMPRTRYRLSLA